MSKSNFWNFLETYYPGYGESEKVDLFKKLERILKEGIHNVSDPDLLAVVASAGHRKENVVNLFNDFGFGLMRKAVENYSSQVEIPKNYDNVHPKIKDIQVGDIVKIPGSDFGVVYLVNNGAIGIDAMREKGSMKMVLFSNGCDEDGLQILPLTGKDWRTSRGLRMGDICLFSNELETIGEVGLLHSYDIETNKFAMGYLIEDKVYPGKMFDKAVKY